MPGLLRGVARTAVVAGTASAVGGRVRHRQDQRWAREEAAAAPAPAYAAPAPVYAAPAPVTESAPVKDKLQQLKELGDLKAQGVLTEAEFAAEKAKILAG